MTTSLLSAAVVHLLAVYAGVWRAACRHPRVRQDALLHVHPRRGRLAQGQARRQAGGVAASAPLYTLPLTHTTKNDPGAVVRNRGERVRVLDLLVRERALSLIHTPLNPHPPTTVRCCCAASRRTCAYSRRRWTCWSGATRCTCWRTASAAAGRTTGRRRSHAWRRRVSGHAEFGRGGGGSVTVERENGWVGCGGVHVGAWRRRVSGTESTHPPNKQPGKGESGAGAMPRSGELTRMAVGAANARASSRSSSGSSNLLHRTVALARMAQAIGWPVSLGVVIGGWCGRACHQQQERRDDPRRVSGRAGGGEY